MQKNIWVNNISELALTPSCHIQAWLLKPYIISHALKRSCQVLTVKVLRQSFSEPFGDEMDRLGFDTQQDGLPWVRCVYLQGDGVPWTYGRVIIPPKTYQVHIEKFEGLNQKLIGERLLFNNPLVIREPFEYICLNKEAGLYQDMMQDLPYVHTQDPVWGRRSVFRIEGAPLMVSEYFLPKIPSYIECEMFQIQVG
ncbi:MAG TPA: chorismate lyase [Gammaproteobacteria bacterium]|nr:chorismate lyase [Gammaproteobacteria bacterium]